MRLKLSAEQVFNFKTTLGIDPDILDAASIKLGYEGIDYDLNEFDKLLKNHQAISRKSAVKKFNANPNKS